jgi:hypothetical protein
MANLMLASFGLEIVECGGALAKAIRSGDEREAASWESSTWSSWVCTAVRVRLSWSS